MTPEDVQAAHPPAAMMHLDERGKGVLLTSSTPVMVAGGNDPRIPQDRLASHPKNPSRAHPPTRPLEPNMNDARCRGWPPAQPQHPPIA